jgi:hypothetical protein
VIFAAQVVFGFAADVEVDELVDRPPAEAGHLVDGISNHLVSRERFTSDEHPVLQQETRDQPRLQHAAGSTSRKFFSNEMPTLWLFSGWNCTPKMFPDSMQAAKFVPYSQSPDMRPRSSGTTA